MIQPIPSVLPQGPVNYQYYDISRRPLIGSESELWKLSEYQNKVVPVSRSCYGVYDTADLTQQHFGRTLHEVLTKIACNEFHYLQPPQYRWVSSPKKGVRVLVFLQWTEIAHMPKNKVRKARSSYVLNGR